MIGGLSSSASRLAIVAAAGLMLGSFAVPAKAADLGGDCCADLEERVAELEATTVRKGNRKVSVTLSGQINHALVWFDDGNQSDVYVVDADELSGSRFRIVGSGTLNPGWKVGYALEIAAVNSASSGVSANEDDADDGLYIRKSEWYLDGEGIGRISLGQGSMATDGITEINLGASYTGYHSGSIWTSSFVLWSPLLNAAADPTFDGYSHGVTWGDVLSPLDGGRSNRIRYDSPTLAGFTLSAAWGEDDQYDVALRFANEWNGFRVAAGAGYAVDNDDNGTHPGILDNLVDSLTAVGAAGAAAAVQGFIDAVDDSCEPNNPPQDVLGWCDRDITTYGISGSVHHVPSGLFIAGSYWVRDLDFDVGPFSWGDVKSWSVSGGWRGRMTEMGQSVLSLTYGRTDNLLLPEFFDSYAEYWNIGFDQDIDAVGATAYLAYRHQSFSWGLPDSFAGFNVVEDMDTVIGGMIVRF